MLSHFVDNYRKYVANIKDYGLPHLLMTPLTELGSSLLSLGEDGPGPNGLRWGPWHGRSRSNS